MSTDTHLSDLEISPFTDDAPAPRLCVERAEPVAIAEALTGLLVGIESIEGVAHPFGGMCKVCAQMEPPVETKLTVLWRRINHPRSPGWFAVNCCDACYDFAKKDRAREERNREAWERVCPVEFRKPWDNRLADRKLLDRILSFNVKEKRGLIIAGDTGSAKSRAAWCLARKLAEDGVSFLFIESIDLLEAIPPEAFTVQVLIIDDLGQDALKGASEVRLLKLLRTRCDWHRPVIITTQFDGATLAKKFSDTGTAKAILRRLGGFCDPVRAKPVRNDAHFTQ